MNELPPNVKDILKKYGNETIKNITVCRTPVNAVVTGVIKAVATTPYDVLFHLFIVIITTSGNRILFEKNERINSKLAPNLSTVEKMAVQNPPQCTINQLIQNTSNYMGSKFIPYSASGNNCQNFIMGILQSNGVNEQNLFNFVKQDTASIFRDPNFRKFANTVTGMAGNFNKLMQGGSIDNELSNHDIDAYLHDIKGYNGCFVNGELKKIPNGFSVVNLNGHSHWTCIYKSGNKCYYFDSFGCGAPDEIERIEPSYVYSHKQIQGISQSSCGFFVIAFVLFLNAHKDKEQAYKQFEGMFSTPKNNEKILQMLLPR